MARLLNSASGNIKDHPTSDIGSPDGWYTGSVARQTDTTDPRDGLSCLLHACGSGDTCYTSWSFAVTATGNTEYGRGYFKVTALPASGSKRICELRTAAGGALMSVRLNADGTFELWDDVAAVQVGSSSTLVAEVDRGYRIQPRLKIAAGAADEVEVQVSTDDYQADPESLGATGLNLGDTHAGRISFGVIDSFGAAVDMRVSSVAVNDSTGTDQSSWCPDGSLVYIPAWTRPLASSWTDCSGSTAGAQDGVNKQPPVGQADHVTAGHTGASAHQARVVSNSALQLDVNTRSYAGAGVPGTLAQGSAGTAGNIGSATSDTRRAQSFVYGIQQTIASLDLALYKFGSPADGGLPVEVHQDSGGVPSGTPLASGFVSDSAMGTTLGGFVTVTLDTALAVQPGVRYWIVVRRTGAVNASNYYSWGRNNSDSYTDGATAIYTSGGVWSATATTGNLTPANDHGFRVRTTQGEVNILVVQPVVCSGQATTGTKGGTVACTNPTIASKAFNYGNGGAVAGTYPSNWYWTPGNLVYQGASLAWRGIHSTTRITIVKNSGTGTGANAAMLCAAGIIVEYALMPSGWSRWQKTADSTFHWAKQFNIDSDPVAERADGTTFGIAAGDWMIYQEPQIGDGEDLPATTTTITDDTLRTGYTPM